MTPAPPRSALLALYLFVSRRASGVARRFLERRAAAGKEDPARLSERMGVASVPRPEGRVAWFHAASVGEAASLLELLRRLQDGRPDLHSLVTTGTLTSAQLLEARLPPRCIHQFATLDVGPMVERFFDHWRPDVAVWTESELWPATLVEARRRGAPMALINARISNRSYKRWRIARGMARALLCRFDRILAQDDLAGEHFLALGADPARLEVTGSLKEGAAPLGHDETERVRIARALAGRPVWLAASTHPGEEEMALEAHAVARRTTPMLALLLAPRHPARGDALAATLRARGLAVAQRSKAEPLSPDTDVYLADTLGEMGLWLPRRLGQLRRRLARRGRRAQPVRTGAARLGDPARPARPQLPRRLRPARRGGARARRVRDAALARRGADRDARARPRRGDGGGGLGRGQRRRRR